MTMYSGMVPLMRDGSEMNGGQVGYNLINFSGILPRRHTGQIYGTFGSADSGTIPKFRTRYAEQSYWSRLY